MAIREDVWLSGVFGRPVFALEAGDADLPFGPGRALYYARVGVDDVAAVRQLEARGFSVVDVNVALALDPAEARPAAAGFPVEVARPEHAEALLEIAGSCFSYSRFHLDPAIPRELADRVKREWVRSYVEGRRGIELLAALDGGRPVGFLAALEAGRARVIDLVGVATGAARSGVGSALVSAFLERHGPRCDELRVGTQIANVPSLRLYARHGFAIAGASYVLHLHTGP